MIKVMTSLQVAQDTVLVHPDGTRIPVPAGSWLVPDTRLEFDPRKRPAGLVPPSPEAD